MPTKYPQAEERPLGQFTEVPTSPYAEISDEVKMELVDELKKEKGEIKLIKFHHSLCPKCTAEEKFDQMKVPSAVYSQGGKVLMLKNCPKHGFTRGVYWEDIEMYRKAEKLQDAGIEIEPQVRPEEINCPGDCGLCEEHETHTGLGNIVLTNRCDLSCWYCFFFAKEGEPVYEPSLGQIRAMMEKLRGEKPVACNALQVTGGEPALREDIIEIIKLAREVGFEHVQLNTNGIRLAQEPEFARAVRKAGSHVLYMSFDGVSPKTNPKNYWEAPRALENCRRAGLGVVLVPTVIGGVNDQEVGDIIRFGASNIDIVRSVNFQPVSLVGRMPDKERKEQRITIPGTIEKIEEQTEGQIRKEDFYPVPTVRAITDFMEVLKGEPKYRLSAHFACGMATYVFKEGDKLIPLPRFFDVEGFLEYLDGKKEEIEKAKIKKLKKAHVLGKLMWNIRKFIDDEKKPEGLNLSGLLSKVFTKGGYRGLEDFHHNSLFIGMMHFQDPYNYDTDRVHKCCIHYATPDGRIIPFCAFNVIPALYRDKIQKEYSMSPEEWEKKTGKKLKDDKYQRKLTKKQKKKVKKFYKDSLKGKKGSFGDKKEEGKPEKPGERKDKMKSGRKKEKKNPESEEKPVEEKTETKEEKPIKKDMIIGELVRKYPQAARILLEKGIHCVGCHIAGMETLEQGLKGHGKTEKEIEGILKELNEAVSERE